MSDLLSEIASDLIKDALFEVVENMMGTKNYQINLEPGSKVGDNYIGIVYRILFKPLDKSQYIGRSQKKPSKLFLKVAPTNPDRREHFFTRPCFLREIYVYNEVRKH